MSIAAAILDRLLCCFPEFLPSLISSSIPIPEGAVVVLSAHVDATFQIIFQSLSAFGQIKLHAQYCAPRSWENARAHEVFAHHFRLPRRGEKMAHLVFLLCFCIAIKREWHPYPLRIVVPANGKAGVILAAGIMSQKAKKSQQSTALQHGGIVDFNYKT